MKPNTMFAAIEMLLVALVGAHEGGIVAYHDRIDGLLVPMPYPLAHFRPVVERAP